MAPPKKHAQKVAKAKVLITKQTIVVHKLTSSRYVINMLNVLQFVNGDIKFHLHSPCKSEGCFFFGQIFLEQGNTLIYKL
jgi:hypothetical protein